jgi:peptidoglycan/LPS O-acetylase OafA/YrhL
MRGYFKSLDSLRALAVFFVMLYHYTRLSGADPSVIGFSWIAVQMFFVQSGFLITSILLEGKSNPPMIFARNFYWRRILRIMPVYFLYVGVFLFIYLLIQKPPDFLQRLPYLITFTYNYSRFDPELNFNSIWFIHFWSLAVEEQFYFFWPLIVYFFTIKNLRGLSILIIFLTPIFRYWLVSQLILTNYETDIIGEINYAFTLSQFDAFAMGAAIPLFNLKEKIKNPGKWSIVFIVVLLIAGLINYFLIKQNNPNFSPTSIGLSIGGISNFQHVWSYSLCNLCFLLIILYLIQKDYSGFFNNRILTSAGKIAYGMYVYHFIIIFLFMKLNDLFIKNHILSFSFSVLTCYLVSYLSYNYFEQKFLSLKNYWNNSSD